MTKINATTLADRLALCAEALGSKRVLAQTADISESQLFRYLKGQIDP